MDVKKLMIIAVVAFVLFFLITQPTNSADTVHQILYWLRDAAEAIITFVRSLFG